MPSLANSPLSPVKSKDTGSSSSSGRGPRTLILCFDGTADQYDGENTNVVNFYSLLNKDAESNEQLCYYQPGIGTYFNPGMVSPVFQWCAKILDEAFAWYLDAHVRGGYEFLMQNYMCGDKICIFGFSRGAYTARALAGMLYKIGLLPRDNPEQVPFAYKLFKKTDSESLTLAAGFKETFCRDVQIEFLGAWDTVASVGVITGRTLPFTNVNPAIKTFRHALSLDEHRVRFLPNLYSGAIPEKVTSPSGDTTSSEKAKKSSQAASKVKGKTAIKRSTASVKRPRALGSFTRKWPSRSRRNAATVALPELKPGEVEAAIASVGSSGASESSNSSGADDANTGGTDVLEVWFSGCHSDVGGGSVPDATKLSLAEITLRWMVREVVLAKCGVQFDQAALLRANIPDSIFTGQGTAVPASAVTTPDVVKTDPMTDVEVVKVVAQAAPTDAASSGDTPSSLPNPTISDPLQVSADALQPLHDELQEDKLWWLLEIIPMPYQYQDSTGKWVKKWVIHLGRGREIPDIKPKFHITVKERMLDKSLNYAPRATWVTGTETYVM